VPVGVWVTVVSTGSAATDWLITVCALAVVDVSASARADAASLRDGFMNASSLLGSNPQREAKAQVSDPGWFPGDHFAT
jgi:hypothetical protein